MSSSIGPSSSTTVGLPTTVGTDTTSAPATTSTSTSPASTPNVTPLYAGFPLSGPTTTGSLGVRAPRNAEDLAAILAEVSLALEDTFGANRSETARNVGAQARGASGQIAAVLAGVAQAIADKGGKTTDLANAQASLATDQAASAAKGNDIATYQGQVDALTGKIDAENAKPANQRDGAKIAAWTADRTTAQSNLDGAQSAKATIDARITATQGTITTLQGAIRDLTTLIGQQSLLATQLQATVVSVFAEVARTFQSGDFANAPKDVDRRENLDRAFSEIFDTLQDFRAAGKKTDDDRLRASDALDDASRDRTFQVALGLAAGLSEALAVLSQVDPSLGVDPQEEALDDGHRFRISV